ncbi:MAG: alpha/beta hydrolase-fold protein, partial [Opitutus sp.]
APGEEFSLVATVDDLRGHRAANRVEHLKVAAGTPSYGIKGATVPSIAEQPATTLTVDFGAPITLTIRATGSGNLTYRWYRDGIEVPGANAATLSFPQASAALSGRYRVLVHGVAGSVLSAESVVTVTPATAGRIETLAPLNSQFVAQRRVDVWLPPGYDANKDAHYPVLYMHDGQNIFDPVTGYGGVSWEVDRAICRLMKAGKIPGVIVVGVWNTPARFNEYMFQKAITTPEYQVSPGWPVYSKAAIQGDAYLKYLVTELKPLIDRTYRTLPDAAHTGIMGSSMGGLISAYALNEYPDVFGRAGCVSTHWPLGDGMLIGYFTQH